MFGRGRYEVCYCVAGKVKGACVPGCVGVKLYLSVRGKCIYIYVCVCVCVWGGGVDEDVWKPGGDV